MKHVWNRMICQSGYLLYYLFYCSLGGIIVLDIFWKEYLTKEVLYIFFFIAGLYAGGRITYYSLKYTAKCHYKNKMEEKVEVKGKKIFNV